MPNPLVYEASVRAVQQRAPRSGDRRLSSSQKKKKLNKKAEQTRRLVGCSERETDMEHDIAHAEELPASQGRRVMISSWRRGQPAA